MFSLDVSSPSSLPPSLDEYKQLISQLVTHGFTLLNLPKEDTLLLESVIEEGRKMKTFRFPPVDGQTSYNQIQKEGFKTLFKWSTYILHSLLNTLEPCTSHPRTQHLLDRLERTASKADSPLFAPRGEGVHPFRDESDPFGTTFFNVFHYDHGLLNHHQDRGLITVIYVAPPSQPISDSKTALWVRRSPEHALGATEWINADQYAGQGRLIVMLGEDFERFYQEALTHFKKHKNSVDFDCSPLWAAEHTTCVDPEGGYISHAHFRPDPKTSPTGNRVSTAMILCDDHTQ